LSHQHARRTIVIQGLDLRRVSQTALLFVHSH
jgi:hypothetical protein